MQTTTASKLLISGMAAVSALLLAGCGSLHDERYSWCQGRSCEAAPIAKASAAVPAKVAEPIVQRVTLSADALFEFDRAGANDMLPKGRAELDALASSLRSQDAKVQSLTITGHTDRLGDVAYNDRLSQQRANTVRAYLQAAGVTVPMQVRAMGERGPVSRNCEGKERSASLIACLQPDRRVVVDWLGDPAK